MSIFVPGGRGRLDYDPAADFTDTNLPVVGDIVPQFGATIGAKISIDDRLFKPSELRIERAQNVGNGTLGNPFVQGLPTLIVTFQVQTMDNYQALYTIYNTKLNIFPGPFIDLIWPNPDNAGRYILSIGLLEEPSWSWSELWIRQVECRISQLGITPEELQGY